MSVQQFLLGETMRQMALAEGALGRRYVVQQLADSAGESTSVPSQEYPDIDAENMSAFTHWCDPERAIECLAEAMRYSEAQIDRMPPAEQFRVVERSWKYFGLYFAYMNLSIFAWGKMRRVFQQALGSIRSVHWVGNKEDHDARADARMGFLSGEERPNGQTWAMWRKRMVQAYMAMGRGYRLDPGVRPGSATFGGIGEGDVDEIRSEMFSLWFANIGREEASSVVSGNQLVNAGNFRSLFPRVNPTFARTKNTLGWMFPTLTSTEASGGEGDNPFTWHTAVMRENMVGALTEIHLTMAAPMHWYWSLLFGKIPGLRMGGTVENMFPAGCLPFYQGSALANPGGVGNTVVVRDGPTGPGMAQAAIGGPNCGDASQDLSLAEYIMKMGPAAMVLEVRRDVLTNNTPVIQAMNDRLQLTGTLADPVRRAELDRVKNQQEQASKLSGAGVQLGISLAKIPTPVTMAAGAIIGLGSFVAGVITNSLFKPEYDERLDVYGRGLPVGLYQTLEFFRLADSGVTQGLTVFLARWKKLGDDHSDLVRAKRSLNQILREEPYVRSVLGFPEWLAPEIYEGVPGYVPPVPVVVKEYWTRKRIAGVLAIASGAVVVVGAAGLALWRIDSFKMAADATWGATKKAWGGASSRVGEWVGRKPAELPAPGATIS